VAPLALPYNFAAEELGYHAIGSFMEVFPNFQLTVLAGSRAWSEAPATEFMIKEFGFKPAHARKAWQYYAGNKAWDYDGRVSMEGMKAVIQMAAEQNQTKGPPEPGEVSRRELFK